MNSLQVILPEVDASWTRSSGVLPPRPTKEDEEWCIAHPGQPQRPMQIPARVSFSQYARMNVGLPRCMVHPFIPNEDKMGMTLTDVEFCPDLIVKIGGISMSRDPSPGKLDMLEHMLSPESTNDAPYRAIPGDAFLAGRRKTDMTVYIDPEIPVPDDWIPRDPNASPREKNKEKAALYRSLNASRSSRIVRIVWDYFTVRTPAGGWRRKTIAYEEGTPSPFQFEYYDTS